MYILPHWDRPPNGTRFSSFAEARTAETKCLAVSQTDFNCQRVHSAEISEANRARLIARRRRMNAAAHRLSSASAKTRLLADSHRTGRLMDFNFAKNWGWITPSKQDRGGAARKQRVFFHGSQWTGTRETLPKLPGDLPMGVRYIRQENKLAQGVKWRATSVSALHSRRGARQPDASLGGKQKKTARGVPHRARGGSGGGPSTST